MVSGVFQVFRVQVDDLEELAPMFWSHCSEQIQIGEERRRYWDVEVRMRGDFDLRQKLEHKTAPNLLHPVTAGGIGSRTG